MSHFILNNMKNINVIGNQDVCRACLKTTENCESHSFCDFVQFSEDIKFELKYVYRRITGIDVLKDSQKPQQICYVCTENLCSAFDFLRCVETSEKALETYTCTKFTIKNEQDESEEFIKFDGIEESAESNVSIEEIEQEPEDEAEGEEEEENEEENEDYQALDDIVSLDDDSEQITVEQSEINIDDDDGTFEAEEEQIKVEDNNKEETAEEAAITIEINDMIEEFSLLDEENYTQAKPKRGTRTARFSCTSCERVFAKRETLDRHVHKAHTPAPREYISAMAPKPTPQQPFQCTECPLICTNKYSLKRHFVATHPDIVLPDELYDEKMANNSNKEKKYKRGLCPYCGESFAMASLIIHLRRHRGEKPYQCDECDKGFPRRQDLMIHKRQHTGERPHVCTVCGKAFIRPNKLTRHMRIHLGIRPYKCTECDKSFSQSNDLKIHLRRHSGEKPYVCGICQQGFISGTMLKQHRKAKEHYEPDLEPVDPYATCRVTARPPAVLEEVEIFGQ